MRVKLLVVFGVLFLLLILAVVVFIVEKNKVDNKKEDSKQYQGPVRPTDDEAYFRKTGITKPLEVNG